MKKFIEWLEKDNARLRKLLAIFTATIWLVCTIATYVLIALEVDALTIYSVVTAQFATVIGFYMTTKPTQRINNDT